MIKWHQDSPKLTPLVYKRGSYLDRSIKAAEAQRKQYSQRKRDEKKQQRRRSYE